MLRHCAPEALLAGTLKHVESLDVRRPLRVDARDGGDESIGTMTDARRLSPQGQEDLRRRVVAAIDGGMSQLQAARVFGVSRRAVGVWFRAYRSAGPDALRMQRRGRPPGAQLALARRTQAELLQELASGPPDSMGLSGAAWSRRSVSDLIARQTGRRLNPTTVGHYMTRWGIAPAPGTVGPQRAPSARRTFDWDRANPGDTQTLWLAWARPVPKFVDHDLLPGPGTFGAGPRPGAVGPPPTFLEALIAHSGHGDLLFTVANQPYRATDVVDFGHRLTRCLGRPVHLIVWTWPAEEAAVLAAWAADPGPQVRLTAA